MVNLPAKIAIQHVHWVMISNVSMITLHQIAVNLSVVPGSAIVRSLVLHLLLVESSPVVIATQKFYPAYQVKQLSVQVETLNALEKIWSVAKETH